MKKRFSIWDYVLFGVVYFVQGALALAGIAMPIFLRESLGLTITQIATLSAIISMPWTIKPLYGLLTDYIPIRGLRRKPYILLMSLIASFGWVLTAINGTYWTVLIAQVCATLGLAATDVAADGLAIQKSTPERKGKIQSVCWGARSLGAVVAGFLGGYLLNFIDVKTVFAFNAVFPLLVFVAVIPVYEEKVKIKKLGCKKHIKNLFKTYMTTPLLWWVSAFLFVWFMAPSFGTPLFFYVKDTLGMDTTFLGILRATSSVGGVVGALLFGKWLDKINQRMVFTWLIIISSLMSVLFYLVRNPTSALIIYFLNGLMVITVTIAAMKLIVGVCPKGIEATTFAIVTSITNFSSGVVGQFIGGQLYALIGYEKLILANAAVSLLPLFLLGKIFRR